MAAGVGGFSRQRWSSVVGAIKAGAVELRSPPRATFFLSLPFAATIRGGGCALLLPSLLAYNQWMANLTLVYGMRLLPSDEVVEVGDAPVKLRNGHEARVTMHVLEGGKEEIEKQLKTSLEAFFDFYPEI